MRIHGYFPTSGTIAALLAIAAAIILGFGALGAWIARCGRAAGWLLVLAVLLVLFSVGAAFAQIGGDRTPHHHEFHRDFYRHWKQPGVKGPDGEPVSCCSARVTRNGQEQGDCEPTHAEIKGGKWHAWVRQLGRYIEIDDKIIVRERNPNGQDAHLCWTPYLGPLCFNPPDTGG